jgi:branched-subunit amino acid ABC-type transport system permease component
MEILATWFDANLISILNGVARGMLLFLMAAGLSMIFGLGDVLNLTHGGIFLFGSYVGWQFLSSGNNFFVALAAAVGAGVLLGLILSAVFILFFQPLLLGIVFTTLLWALVGGTVAFLARLSQGENSIH